MNGSDSERAEVNVVDVLMTFFVMAGLLALAPFYYKFVDMVSAVADPFSALLLQLIVPFLFIALIVSVGRSARGSA